jgi:hypothetical protein
MAMWRLFDAGEIREDFARIAELGLDSVRFFVRWDELQPDPKRVDAAMLERLETLLSLAAATGLRALPSLCGTLEGVPFMPAWAREFDDLYTGPLLEAQLVIAQAIAERLRAHPALLAWDIAHAFTDVRPPRHGKMSTGDHGSVPIAERDVAAWSKRINAVLKPAGIATTAGAVDTDITTETNVRMGSLCTPFAFASMQGSSVSAGFARNRLDPEVLPFLAMVTAAFSFKPVLITALGNPTCPAGKFSPYERFALPGEPPHWSISPEDTTFATYPCLSEDENAAYATAVLERLHADGRLGAYWWCWSDYDEEVHPGTHERTCGIIRRDGSEKPVARAIAAFAREPRAVVKPAEMPMISSTYYYRTLPVSTRTLYDAFLSFVDERRGAAARR